MIQLATEEDLVHLLSLVCAYHEFEMIELTNQEREKAVHTLVNHSSLGAIWLCTIKKTLLDILHYVMYIASNLPGGRLQSMNSTSSLNIVGKVLEKRS